MYELGETLAKQAKDAGVDIRLNTAVTPEYVEKENVDKLIVAIGSKPLVPPIKGIDGDNVVIVNDYHEKLDEIKDEVVVLGGGLAGCEIAIHLANEGKEVHLVEMRSELAVDANIRHRPILLGEIEKKVNVHTGYRGLEVSENGVLCADTEGNEQLVEGATVICAAGQRALRDDADAMLNSALSVSLIGDCIRPSTITKAIYEGHHAALDI